MENKCPYCGATKFVPDYVCINIESYGSNYVRFPCSKCKKIIKSYGRRCVVFSNVEKTNDPSDW